MEDEISCPCDRIGATGEDAAMLCQKQEDPLPLPQLIFLNRNNDIRGWFLPNKGDDPMELIVLESHREDGEDLDEIHEPANGRYPLFDHNIWAELAGGGDSVREMPDEESVENEEWLEAEAEGETWWPHGAG